MKKLFLACLTMCAMFLFVSQDTQAQDIHGAAKTKAVNNSVIKSDIHSSSFQNRSLDMTKVKLQPANVKSNTVTKTAVKNNVQSLNTIAQPALDTKKAALIKK